MNYDFASLGMRGVVYNLIYEHDDLTCLIIILMKLLRLLDNDNPLLTNINTLAS